MYKLLLAATCVIGASNVQAHELHSATLPEFNSPEFVTDWCKTFDAERAALDGRGDCPIEGECDIPAVRDSYLTDESTPWLTVRVYLHVFRASNGSDPAATEADVINRMAEINEDYAPWHIRFIYEWAYHNDSTHRYDGGGLDDQMKLTYSVQPDRFCNVYIRGTGYSAYGYFPWWTEATAPLGGIVIHGPMFIDGDHVLAHEMGHNLGLWHTHHGVSEVSQCGPCYERADGQNADTTGDFASDTPPTPINYSCDDPGGIDPCSNVPWGVTLPEDYMSYGFFDPAPCWDRFTPQQAARMHCWINAQLTGWLACAGDLTLDYQVNIDDVFTVLGLWGDCPDPCPPYCPGDITRDCTVNIDDIFAILGEWGPCE